MSALHLYCICCIHGHYHQIGLEGYLGIWKRAGKISSNHNNENGPA